MDIDSFIIKQYLNLNLKDKLISADELYEIQEDNRYHYLLLNNDKIKSFKNIEECREYIEENNAYDLKLKGVVSKSYCTEVILPTVLEYLEDSDDNTIKTIIQKVWEIYSSSNNNLTNFEDILFIIDNCDDLVQEFWDNEFFSKTVLTSYIFDIINNYYLKNIILEELNIIIWKYYNNDDKIQDCLKDLEFLFNIYSLEEKNILAQIIIDLNEDKYNEEELNLFMNMIPKNKLIKYFVGDETIRKMLMLSYIKKINENYKNNGKGIHIYSITKIARDILNELYENYSINSNSKEEIFYLIEEYLISKRRLNKSVYRELFINQPHLELLIKKVAINLIIMDYTNMSRVNKNIKFIEQNNLNKCLNEFYCNDEFRHNLLTKYYSGKRDLCNDDNIDIKYKVLSLVDKLL